MNHFMIDLETMGTGPNAAIVSIGCAHFDSESVLSTFYTPVYLQSCLDVGLTQTPETVNWWQKQSQAAINAWKQPDAPTISDALVKFGTWLRSISPEKQMMPWGNGADFDLVILRSAYEALAADTPWPYYNHMCFRTVKNIFPIQKPARTGVAHCALDDAVYQVEWLQAILRRHSLQLP